MDGCEQTKLGWALEVPGEAGETHMLSWLNSLEPPLPYAPLQSPAERLILGAPSPTTQDQQMGLIERG